MKYQTMRIDHLKHLNIEALIGNVELIVNGDTLTINPIAEETKPRTKVEYVKVGISDVGFSDIADLFFMESDGNFVEIGDIDAAKLIADKWKLHRRIETPMTEREAFIDGYEKLIDGFMGDETKVADDWAGYVFDKLVK
jgi:hypothetical protein